MINFKKWFENNETKFLEYSSKKNIYKMLFEQQFKSNARFEKVTKQDIDNSNMLNSNSTGNNRPYIPNDFYGKIVNVTPYELMLQTRENPIKFAKDFATLQKPNPDLNDPYTQSMIMEKEKLLEPIVIYILNDDSWTEIFRDAGGNSLKAFTYRLEDKKAIFMQTKSFKQLPNQSNPIGIFKTELEKNFSFKDVMAHEAGHAGQGASQTTQNFGFGYLGKPKEVGTRLGFLKNANTKQNLIQMVQDEITNQQYKEILITFIKEVLPSDEMERLKLFINNEELVSKDVLLNKELINMAKQNKNMVDLISRFSQNDPRMTEIFYSVIGNFYNSIRKYFKADIQELIQFIQKLLENNQKETLMRMLQYAYPRVVFGQPNAGDQQQANI